jgi:serine/threonine-protein kinase
MACSFRHGKIYASSLASLHVVSVEELDRDGDDLFMVMEYLAGEAAAFLVRHLSGRGRILDPGLAAFIVAEAAAGLHAAHEKKGDDGEPLNIVHRDISPQNLFVTYDGSVKVLDFGIAKAADRITRTETGHLKGKERYMSPEQAMAKPLDRRSDIFSLGVVLYELTTGRRLFKRRSKLETLVAVRDAAVKRPSLVVPDYPKALEGVCLRALSRSPDQRYSTAAEMRRELLAAAREAGLDTVPDEALAHCMRSLFPDRIAEKIELLRSLRGGQSITALPLAEVDLSVDIPGIESDVSNVSDDPDKDTSLTTHAWSTNKSGFESIARDVSLREKKQTTKLWIVRLVVFCLCLTAVGLAVLLWPRDDIDTQNSPPSTPSKTAVAAAPNPEPKEIVPPQKTTPVPEKITLEIETIPAGATVIVDDEERGMTPLALQLPRGTAQAQIELKLDGYETVQETVGTDMNGRLRFSLTRRRSRAKRVRSNLPRQPRDPTGSEKAKASPFRAFD